MSGQKAEDSNYTKHIIVFLLLTTFMYMFAYLLVDHNLDVPERVDTVHGAKQE